MRPNLQPDKPKLESSPRHLSTSAPHSCFPHRPHWCSLAAIEPRKQPNWKDPSSLAAYAVQSQPKNTSEVGAGNKNEALTYSNDAAMIPVSACRVVGSVS